LLPGFGDKTLYVARLDRSIRYMFETFKLFGSTEVSIALETRRRRSIPNSQAPDTDPRSRAKFARLMKTHGNWRERKAPCGIYNCFGHIWASRRTSIYEEDAVEMILEDDDYRWLSDQGQVREGDLALYI
jgi:hypothetical protein